MCDLYISEFLYLGPEVRRRQARDRYIASLWENIEMPPARVSESKPTIISVLCKIISSVMILVPLIDRGTRKGHLRSYDVINRFL